MSLQSRKKRKDKERLKELEKANGHLSSFLCENPVLLEFSPKQLISYFRICSRVYRAQSEKTGKILIQLIQAEKSFSRHNVKDRIKHIVSSPTFQMSADHEWTDRSFPQDVKDCFLSWTPNELLEFVGVCNASQNEAHILLISRMLTNTTIDINCFRYEDVDMAINLAKIKKVMDT